MKAEGGEVMLEAMNAADRKVVHDTVAEIDGIRSLQRRRGAQEERGDCGGVALLNAIDERPALWPAVSSGGRPPTVHRRP